MAVATFDARDNAGSMNQSSGKSAPEVMCAKSTGDKNILALDETADSTCCFWPNTGVEESHLNEQRLTLTILVPQFTRPLATFSLLDSQASPDIHITGFKQRTVDDQFQSGIIPIRRLDVSIIEDNSNMLLNTIDSLNELDDDVKFSEWSRCLTNESLLYDEYSGLENGTSDLMSSSPSKETTSAPHGNFCQKNGGEDSETHCVILTSSSGTKAHCQNQKLKCSNLSIVSHSDTLLSSETPRYYMHVKPHDSTEDFGLRGLEFLAHDDLEDHIKISKASHIYIHTQNSVLHQKLLPNAEFHYLRSKRGRVLAQGLKYETECLRESDGLGIMPSKYDDSETHLGFPWSDNPWIDYTNPFSQPHKSADIKIVMNPSEFLAVDSGPVNSSQSQVASKPAKRSRDDSGQVQVEQLGEHASSQSLSRKRPRLEEDSGGFACPFYKKDPWKFHLCLNYKLSKICYVKQHLSRYHNDASKYCPICHRQFNDEIERGSHILAKDCQQSQSTFHVMTADQKKDIHLAAGRKISVEEKWYQIWTILFPCAKRPDSPYVKGHVFAEALSSIRAFCRGPGAHIVTQTFRQANYHGLTDHDLFDEILSQIESQALTHSPEPPSTLHLDDGIDTECTDSLNVSTSPDSHSANSINSVLDSPSMVITGDYGLVIPHLLPISNDGQEALGSSSETLLCDLEAGSDHFEYDSAGAGELFDLAEPGFSYKLSRPRDGYDSESCADNDDFLDILAFPGSPGGVTI